MIQCNYGVVCLSRRWLNDGPLQDLCSSQAFICCYFSSSSMEMSKNIVLGFEVEYFDEISGIVQPMYLKFWIQDNTLEIMQQSNNKAFLKRIYSPNIRPHDLFIGSSLTIFSRVYILKKYANIATERYMKAKETHYLVVSNSMDSVTKVIQTAQKMGLVLGSVRTNASSSVMSFDDVVIDQDSTLIEFVGFNSSKSEFHQTISTTTKYNDVSIVELSQDRIQDIFHACKGRVAVASNSTLCFIKPHAVKSQQTGDIMQSILSNGFAVQAVLSIHMTLSMAEELIDIYRTVLPNYIATAEQLCSGPAIALMVTSSDACKQTTVEDFRELCGPVYPELAAAVRPKSIRARYGASPSMNAVHCTDLAEDGEMECRYIFDTLGSL
jgi:nucleoside-diphosphate kinase